jgi:flagellar basal-body rod protein FlgG
MLQTTRHFESAQKLYQGYDEMLGSAIQKLGQF